MRLHEQPTPLKAVITMTDSEFEAIRRHIAEHKAATEFPTIAADPDDRFLAASAHAEYGESEH